MLPIEVIEDVAAQVSAYSAKANPVMPVLAALPPKPVTAQCVIEEARKQQIDVLRLVSILKTENGRVGGAVRAGSTYDLGPMGINTVHLDEFARVFKLTPAQTTYLLIYDGCFNVAVGAWHLRRRTNEVSSTDESSVYWYGIGRYHSRTPQHSANYIMRVHTNMRSLMAKANQNG